MNGCHGGIEVVVILRYLYQAHTLSKSSITLAQRTPARISIITADDRVLQTILDPLGNAHVAV